MAKPAIAFPGIDVAAADLLTACGQLVRRLRAESNNQELSWSQMAVLARLEEAGPMSIADMARAESVKPQSMGVTLSVMEEEGLLERQAHPTDGRQFLFALTAAGSEARRRVRAAKQTWLAGAVASLTADERRDLLVAAAVIRRLADSNPRHSSPHRS
jgi:DNA-binding MarR family transcriptional regulator